MARRSVTAAFCCFVALLAAASSVQGRSLNTFLPATVVATKGIVGPATVVATKPVSVVVTKTTPVLPFTVVASKGVTVTPAPAPPVCSNVISPPTSVGSGSRWRAEMSGAKNIKPGTTGVPAPMPGPPRGTYDLTVDEAGQKASWTLTLCDFPKYIASHLHTGSAIADYPPPLIPLEPFVKPANPFAPPTLLPQLCPAQDIVGCSYTKSGSFSAADITPLPGRQPQGDLEVPTVGGWADFLAALKAGKIYANVHSLVMPAGLIRGNLAPVSG